MQNIITWGLWAKIIFSFIGLLCLELWEMNILLVNVTYYSDLKTSWQAIGKQNPTQINDDDDNTRLVAFFKATRVKPVPECLHSGCYWR